MTNIFFISVGFLFIQLAFTFTNILDEKQLVEDLKNEQKQWNDIEIQFSQGDYAGFFSANKTYAILDELASSFPLVCKFPQIIGYTFEDRAMFVYPLSNIQKEDLKEENAVFLNGLHHAREPLSVSMGLYTYVYYLYNFLRGNEEIVELLNNTVLWFLPIVNIDTYEFNVKYYRDKNIFSYLRKNRRPIEQCTDQFQGYKMGDGHGVDLNRNYGYKFAYNNIGSSGSEKICQEDYRGEGPFSEPETQAIKQFMTETHNIKAAINFHAYGPLWITPYNYYNDKNNSDIVVNSTTYNIYQYYKDNAKFPQHNTFAYGNAKQTIDYQANGDASDWMLHDLGVIAVSIELGSDGKHKEKSYQFYPDQKSILPTLQECLPPVDFLVQMVKPNLILTTYEQYFLPEDAKQTLIRKFFGKKENSDDYQVIIFTFFNQGLSGLRPNPQTRSSFFLINLKLQGHTSENVQKLFTRLFFEIQYEDNVQQELKIDNYTYDYVMHLKQLNKVKKIQFYDMPDGSIDVQIQISNEIPARSYIQFYLVLKNDSDLISHYNNIFDGEDLQFSTKFFIQSEFYKDYYFIGEQKYYINPNDYYFKEQAEEGQSFDVKIIEPKFNLIRVSLENIDFFFVFGILVFIICLIYGVQKYRNSYTVLQLHNIINQDGTEFVQTDLNQDIEISQMDDKQNDSN